MIQTSVLAPVPGHALSLAEVPGERKLLKLLPHAYVIMTAEGVGVLVHLGLDTVALDGAGFTTQVAKGLNPVVPVDEREPGNITLEVPAGDEIACGAALFTAVK